MKTVLLLGATSDIGQALAEKYAKEGYGLLLAGRNLTHLEDISADLNIRYNVAVRCYFFEALDYGSHSSFYEELPGTPDVTICIFGYLGEQERAETEWQECERIMDVNYKAAVSILNIVANSYQKAGSGTIIGISSVAGDRGRQSNYFYGSAKAGFTAYLSGLRNRLFKSQVHVLTVKPGFVNTKMTEGMPLPAPLTAEPQKVASAIYSAARKKKNVLYVLGVWRLIMTVIVLIPEFVFKRLKL
ncbi:short chain dehydrogenase [Fulvivirga imtechensis AK7]|uniref:Short chain dehydrogenase n=1 Tax=Fulvivirga imtechensis AK7 TaxID=1237149 RepID=L8JX35_9BACT|nr:SDR family oxidoreductase [Fulvivirga imtechensis]ELR73345.1 short chain dehydrogenase [Fulvivirga imtechensis AK7]